jgi:predicted RNA methylase
MSIDKNTVIKEISSAFSLSDEAAKTALVLLEARARTLDFTFDEYMNRYHPEGLAKRDENLGVQFQGYVQFLENDAAAVLRAGKGANFNTLMHECAHVFRRQLTGELLEQAEKAFGVKNGIWTREKEEDFAKGLEQWIKRHHKRDRTRADFNNKGKIFVDTVYRGMERVIDIDSRMEAVYENIFYNDSYIFKKNEYEQTLSKITEGKLPDEQHVFLGMTPRIYEELGFQRLPMAMTTTHLFQTLHTSSEWHTDKNYHDLGEDILRQIPEQLKNPLFVLQSAVKETDIVSVIALKDKDNNQIIVPVAYSQKGNINGAEIEINLVKSIYGKENFQSWLNEAVKDNRLLYIDKKKTEPVLVRTLPHTIQDRSIRLPDGLPHSLTAGPTTDVFGFLPDNIAHYKEVVKEKYPERFTPPGERILYKNNEDQLSKSQLSLDFSQPVKIPLPNTPENFKQNFIAISGDFKADTIEAARFILRDMTKENRAAALEEMQKAGCTDKDGYHKYLHGILSSPSEEKEPLQEETEGKIDINTLYRVAIAEFKEKSGKEDRTVTYTNLAVKFQYEYSFNYESVLNALDNAVKHVEMSEKQKHNEYENIDWNKVKELEPIQELTQEQKKDNFPSHVYEENLKEWFIPVDGGFKEEDKKREELKKTGKYHSILYALGYGLFAVPEKDIERWEQAHHINYLRYNKFDPFGAWTDFNSRLSLQERERLNNEAVAVLEKAGERTISNIEKSILLRYSGFGGISASDERGVLYDYYTSPPVAYLVWQLLEKSGQIKDGANILEPSCGTGVFIKYAPISFKKLFFTGVELDDRTAKIAQLLRDSENIKILNSSFETFNLSDKAGSFDHVIGNAPFGERGASLSALDMPEEKSLDNYFVSRSIDNLKDNGTMALIVAPGVLENKTNEEFRLSLNKKAQFIGAVKLPDRSFHHTHTQVMPDILLFRKYPQDIQDRLSAVDDETFKTLPLYDHDFVSGAYFEKHPEHIAGTLSEGTGQWGNDEVKGDITPESLEQILVSFKPADVISENIFRQTRDDFELPETLENKDDLFFSTEELKQIENKTLTRGAVKVSENNIYIISKRNLWQFVSQDANLANKLTDVKAISTTIHAIQDSMKAEKDSAVIKSLQEQCIIELHKYQEKYEVLPADDPDLKRFTRDNPAVQGIYETFLPVTDPLLTQKNVYRKEVEILDGHNTAISALLLLRERMKDAAEETIRASFPDTAETLITEMRKHDDVFITTEDCYQLREDFISGDAWKKIDGLKAAADKENTAWKKEKLLYGAGEIEKAVGWTPIEDADFSPRSSWVPQEIVRDWASNKEALGNSQLENLAKNDEGKWGITVYKNWQEHADPLIYYLNGQKQRSKYYDTEAYNQEHDDLFRSFIANHENYRAQLESEYNRKFKTHIVAPVKTYPVEIAGWKDKSNGGKDIKPHQWQSIHHLYRNQRGISALGTGFGKTVTGIALMSLLRQEDKAHRIFLQVPNNKIKDWIEEIHDVMPSLKIASIDQEEPGYSSRDKRYAKYQAMARSDADIILMPESSASEIQLSAENDAQITQKISTLYKMEKAGSTARQQEMAALKGEYKAASGKTNVTVCFEDFGCDAIFVDEAHRYKNLFGSTLSRETGMNDGRQSAKAMSLYKKCDYIRERNNDKNVYLLTATPLTNSPLEYYNMMQYGAPDELQRMGITTIDGFIREFAHIEQGWLYDWSNGQAKQGNILTGFKNLPTLQNLFFAYTDLQNNPEAIGLEKPSAENQPHIIAADKKQMEAIKAISLELDRYKSLSAEKRQDEFPGQNFLTFYSQMRTASLDLELYDPDKYKNWKNPKLDNLANNAFTNYQKTKGGQVIFCDRVFSSDASFNIHEKIKNELVSQGFKEKDIVIVNGFTKSGGNKSDSMIEKEVSKAIADYNAGKYKVIIGSTACIGEGVNLQKNSSAVHHFDIPFRPSDFIQRNGRVDRQGNEQNTVSLHTYLAAGTIDNYSVNLVQRKANWIDQMLRTKSEVFTNPNDENSIDADELLLALTEEWGDKDAAVKRKEALEIQKQEKIKEAQEKQMKGSLKNLSLARGALLPLNENTAEYKKRMGQITSLETSLKNNPVFTKHDIMDNHDPFLYDHNSDRIYRKNDIIIIRSGTYLIDNFDFKKQKILCTKIESDEEKKKRIDRARQYKWNSEGSASNIIKNDFSLSKLNENTSRYSYDEVLYHLEKTSTDEQEMIKNIKDEKFYKLPEDKKEKYYDMHLTIIKKSHDDFNPVVFSASDDGLLEIREGRYTSCSDKLINPFSAEGRNSILNALEKGVMLPYHDKANDTILESLGKTIPELKDCITQAVDKEEQQKQVKEQKDVLNKEVQIQAAKRLNDSIKHLNSHVHVSGVRI